VDTTLISSIASADSLPSMPVVAFKVLDLCRQEDVDIDDVAEIIEKDPALTAKMLKVANSSMFGMTKQVASLHQAMVVLGLRTVKIMALGFSLVDAMQGATSSGFDLSQYWRRSLYTAVAARLLASRLGDIRRDEAFVGGLLCDVGMIAAERHPAGAYHPVIQRYNAEGGCIQVHERELLGVTHAEISAMMLSNWNMPEVLIEAVSSHHGDDIETLTERSRRLASVLWAASEVSELFCGDAAACDLAEVREGVISRIGMSGDVFDELMHALNDNVQETAELFKLDVGMPISYDDLRQRAVSQMAELSLSAEHERMAATNREREARSQVETLRLEAHTDRLTDIFNRRAFDECMDQLISRQSTEKGNLGLIMIDMDHFKQLNDTHGHLAGDEALKLVGKCLNKIRDESRFVARYGGEEFAVIAADVTARQLRELAEDIRKNISRIKFSANGQEIGLTASLGAVHVSYAEEALKASEMISRADECLYEAKNDGRNRVEITF